MASIVGKKRGKATYYYLVESARVDGKPRIVSQEYLGTADELAAAMRGGGLGLPDRTRHKEFGAIAAAWGMLDDLGVAAIIDQVAGPRPGRAAAAHRDVPGAGGAEPAGRPVLEGRVRGLVENDRRGPVHQDPRHRAGSPAVLGRDARRHPGAAGGDLPQDRGEDRAVRRRGRVLGRAGHDQLRHVHRHRQRQGAGRAAGQGQAETLGPAAGRAGPGRYPGRRDPADLARLPRQQA